MSRHSPDSMTCGILMYINVDLNSLTWPAHVDKYSTKVDICQVVQHLAAGYLLLQADKYICGHTSLVGGTWAKSFIDRSMNFIPSSSNVAMHIWRTSMSELVVISRLFFPAMTGHGTFFPKKWSSGHKICVGTLMPLCGPLISWTGKMVLREFICKTKFDTALSTVTFHRCCKVRWTLVNLEDSFFLCHCSYGEVARFHEKRMNKRKCDHCKSFLYQER